MSIQYLYYLLSGSLSTDNFEKMSSTKQIFEIVHNKRVFMSEEKIIKAKVIEVLKEIYDPELPVNIYDLGLIYDIKWEKTTCKVTITMTLTTPNCPVADILPATVKEYAATIPAVKKVEVVLTFEPPYTPDCMSEDAKMILGWEKKPVF